MEFDYIIVGAGSAGCVLADRLSRSGRDRVLLIEAGGSDARFWIKVPLGYAMTFSDPRVTWRYFAESDVGLNGRVAYWPRGRVLGGSSSVNAMAYVRGLDRDFADWEAAGAAGWGPETVRETYAELESVAETGPDGRPRIRGAGPLRVSDLSARMHPFSANFRAAARELGWPLTEDMNGAEAEGLGYFRATVKGAFRHSAADAFLRPAMKRRNLTVVTGALVERVEIVDGRAVGVRYRQGDEVGIAKARGEVILSAGAINSPQILQLSGIGPGALLRAHGIEVVRDLAEVGEGLQDHLALTQYFSANVPTLNGRLGTRLGRLLAGAQYLLTGRGPLSVPVNQVGGFIRSDPERAAPDMQVYCNPASYTTRPDGKPVIDRAPGFLLCAQPCRPSSRGAVRIASPDPAAPPLIQPNSLATEEDRAAAIRAGRLIARLAAAPNLARLTRAAHEPDIRGMNEAALLDAFRARAVTNYHASCTCRMGRDATNSVLDARLRVHGVAGLRVVDASAFPNVTSGNTNAPVMMLALRAAALIVDDAP